MANQKKDQNSKGNGAHHRMSNDNLKARRKACWSRGEKRKAERRKAQEAAHARNVERGYSAWDVACRKRTALRG